MKQYNTALYMRLSRDDELQGESGSITTQRMILTDYCRENNLHIVSEYVDDGYSGTNYDRPGFQRMIDDIEDGKINCVITKDLSRLGRNYIMTGQFVDYYFPSKGVRYIALGDNIDSEKGESEIAPFLNILNEMHARQTSKKIKAAKHAKFSNGEYICSFPPLGYMKDPDNKNKLIPDEETRWIIEKIFDLAYHGKGASSIRKILEAEKIPTPAWLLFQKYGKRGGIFENADENKRYMWSVTQLKDILKSEIYIGNSVHYRVTNISYKDKRLRKRPEDEWMTIENTHEPLVSKEIFERVQQLRHSRKRPTKDGSDNIFAGLLKCPDCGWYLRFQHRPKSEKYNEYKAYRCGQYAEYGKEHCTIHSIRFDTLYAIVLNRLQYWIRRAQTDEAKLLDELLKSGDKQRSAEMNATKKELTKSEKRLREIDALFEKLYEQSVQEKITERNFNKLSEKYQKEQSELERKISALKESLEKSEQDANGAEMWIKLIKKYTELSELTAPILNELIEKIEVHNSVADEYGYKNQDVDIYYRFVGMID